MKANCAKLYKASTIHCFLLISMLTAMLCIQSGCKPDSAHSGNLASEGLNPDAWEKIDESTLGFRAKFPGKWKYHTEFMETNKGAATVHVFEYWHVAFQYGITVVKFPPGVADLSDPDRVLDYSVNSLISKNGGVVSFQENVNMGGYPARRAMISLPESYLKSARLNTLIILRNNFVYRVSTSGVGNHDHIEYFINSFELTPVAVSID